MEQLKRAGRGWKYPVSVYRRHAFRHFAQGIVVLSAVTVGLCAIVLGVIVLVVGETLLLAVMPRLPAFRKEVEQEIEQLERNAAAAARASIVVRMSESHRRELEHLERLIEQVRARLGRGASDPSNVDDWLGTSQLVATFARFAIAHKASSDGFAHVSRSDLAVHATQLAGALKDARGPVGEWIQRRLAIAEERLATWDRAAKERELMAHGMATIGELVRYLHEQSATSSSEPMGADLEDLLVRWKEDGGTLGDLASLCDKCEPVDPYVFGVARGAEAQPPQP